MWPGLLHIKLDIMSLENRFNDITSYNDNLRKGMSDKLFFLDHLPDDEYLFFDFGCADGSLIEALKKEPRCRGKKHWYVGYDISEEMIHLAQKKLGCNRNNRVFLTSQWEDAMDHVRQKAKRHRFKTVLILSSVIHEVYSYDTSVDTFWSHVTGSGFHYITVRDMMPSHTIDRDTDPGLYEAFLKNRNKVLLPNQIADFEQLWGPLGKQKNFVHFLLKYRWTINWSREVKENYFPICIEEFIDKLKSYQTLFFETFRVKHLDECILKDFGLQLTDNTHVKAVFTLPAAAPLPA